jgi:hypothetical protein
MRVKIAALIFGATLNIGAATAQAQEAKVIPKHLVEEGFVLEVEFAAERNEYMDGSNSITKIRGFRNREECWKHADTISKALWAAAKEAKTTGRHSMTCDPNVDFRKE